MLPALRKIIVHQVTVFLLRGIILFSSTHGLRMCDYETDPRASGDHSPL